MDKLIELVKQLDDSYAVEKESFSEYLKERNELADLHLAKLATIKSEIESIKSSVVNQLEKINSELSTSGKEYELLKANQLQTTKNFEEKLSSLNMLIEAKEQTSSELDVKIESVQSMYDASLIRKKEISQEIIEAQNHLADRESKLRSTENAITVLSKKEEALSATVGELTSQIDTLNTDIRKKTETVTILEKRAADIKNK